MISHNKDGPTYREALQKLFKRHPGTDIIWAHTGLGRYVKARKKHTRWLSALLKSHSRLHVDISWDVVAHQFFKNGKLAPDWKSFLTRHSGKILFGSDIVAPNPKKYNDIKSLYRKIWRELPAAAVNDILHRNYVKIFDRARKKVRSWEKRHLAKKISKRTVSP